MGRIIQETGLSLLISLDLARGSFPKVWEKSADDAITVICILLILLNVGPGIKEKNLSLPDDFYKIEIEDITRWREHKDFMLQEQYI